jgi:GAF domain-containing protein
VAEAQGWVIGMPSPTFDGATEASRLTCENAFARALSLVERDSAQGGTTALEFLLSQLVATQNLDALARLMTLVATTLRCDHVALSCLDAEGQYLEAIHPESWQLEGVRYYLDDYPASKQSLETLQMLCVDIADPHADDAEVEWMLSEGLESVIGVPIVSTGRPIGLLECSKMRATPWTRLQLRHARIVATVLGPVLSSLQSTWH